MFDAERFYENTEMAGTLSPLRLYASAWEAEVPVKGDTPVLVFPVAATCAHCVPNLCGPSTIFFQGIDCIDGMIMTINIQIGGTQFIWFVDFKDMKIWQAIERWRLEKVVPIVLGIESGGSWEYCTHVVEMPSGTLAMEDHLPQFDPMPPTDLWKKVTSGVSGFFVRQFVKTRIDGVPLQHIFACPLLTKKLMSDEYVAPMCEARKVVRVPRLVAAVRD
ncbi:hypothetical protein [Cupriavidus sp. PET2-C1]